MYKIFIEEDKKELQFFDFEDGKRFSIYPSLGRIDKELREKYIKGEILENEEIISFLSSVYVGDKFRFIKEVKIKGDVFYPARPTRKPARLQKQSN